MDHKISPQAGILAFSSSNLHSTEDNMSTRRSFLSLVAATYAAAVFPRCPFAEQTGTAIFTNASLGSYAQGTMTRATFEKIIGQASQPSTPTAVSPASRSSTWNLVPRSPPPLPVSLS